MNNTNITEFLDKKILDYLKKKKVEREINEFENMKTIKKIKK